MTPGFRLVALNAKTGAGQLIRQNRRGDMKVGALVGKGEQINLETGEIGLH
jgi:hypothetical protein